MCLERVMLMIIKESCNSVFQKGQCVLVKKQQESVYLLGLSLLFVTCQRCAILCLSELGVVTTVSFGTQTVFGSF